MDRRIVRTAAALGLACTLAGPAAAETPPLSPDALSRCATQVQALREESSRLTQKNAEYDLRRNAINAHSAQIKADRDKLSPDDLNGGLALRQRIQEHTAATIQFNGEVETLKREIQAVNATKKDYDANCANRPYRRSDLEKLPEPAQNAMRAGLGGVQVPYIAD